jgi:hypothetical protein
MLKIQTSLLPVATVLLCLLYQCGEFVVGGHDLDRQVGHEELHAAFTD